jgi:hypothetical protein
MNKNLFYLKKYNENLIKIYENIKLNEDIDKLNEDIINNNIINLDDNKLNQNNINKNIIAITISTNYSDILDIVLPQNQKFFYKWFIITDKNDINTINIIKKYNFPNVIIIFFNFYSNNLTFNQGDGIRLCQKIIIKSNYNDIILNIDSDIYLPNNFNDLINNIDILPDTIYGTDKRNDYSSYEYFKNNIIDSEFIDAQYFYGYFQLYLCNSNILTNNSQNCSKWDIDFRNSFKARTIIKDLCVSHLGISGVHWNGRKDKTDFIK